MMVASDDPAASQAGLDMLRRGGSATDAVIAAELVLGMTQPQRTGLGGGGYLIAFDAAHRRILAWDGREAAPAAATGGLLLRPDGTPIADVGPGGRAVGTPGMPRLLEAAYRSGGRLPWPDLMQPAIRLATDGIAVSPSLAAAIAAATATLRRQAAAASLFLDGDRPRPAGSLLRNPAYAETLRGLAAAGANGIMRGPVAADIAASVRTDPAPGLLTIDDLAIASAPPRPPLCGAYRGRLLCAPGPSSAGGVVVLETLGLLAARPSPPLGADGAPDPAPIARAEQLATADARAYIADPAFVPPPLPGLLDPAYLRLRARALDGPDPLPDGVPAAPGHPDWPGPPPPAMAAGAAVEEHGTATIIAVDAAGNAAALTGSLGDAFGAGLVARGLVLNDALVDFSPVPMADGLPVANALAGTKRPRSAMAPLLLFRGDGTLLGALGASGGARIPRREVAILVEMFDRQGTLAALATPGEAGRMMVLAGPDGLDALRDGGVSVAGE